MFDFFIISPLGHESSVMEELNLKWPLFFKDEEYTSNQIEGGIEIRCSLDNGLSLNKILKTPTRILLRIKNQKCRDFPKLYRIIQKINWKQYLKKETVSWKITTKESRLLNSTKIENTCNDALKYYFNANRIAVKVQDAFKEKEDQSIFIRVDNDDLTISIDTSGESLHIRGNDPFRGKASIRSTLASVIIQETFKHVKGTVNLIDPMCGSCTYLKEAKNYYAVNNEREYAFEYWHTAQKLDQATESFKIDNFYGFDTDKKIISKDHGFNLKESNVFIDKHTIENSLIICNPPYGKRVKLDRPRNKYYIDLIEAIKSNFNPRYISIIIPTDININKYDSRIKIFNSGIWVYNYFFKLA